jgi:predicted RNA-binding protein (virulence factor B family)
MRLIEKRDTFANLMENGKMNRLKIAKVDDRGYQLINDKEEDFFLPFEQAGEPYNESDEIEVFIYKDGSQRLTAKKPYAQLEEFGFLKVNRIEETGAYVDWGLERELLVPLEEQIHEMSVGNSYLIFVFEDEETGDFIGSQRVDEFVFFDEINVKRGDEVDLLLYRESELGMNAIVNNLFKGLIFASDLHKKVYPGQKIKGYVKQVREDGKIDVMLEPLGYRKSVVSNTQVIINALKENDNFLPLNDKSDPYEVKRVLGLSKKAFKRAAGHLYKQKLIEIRQDGLHLIKDPASI